jgi:hypothetical protein
MTDDKTATSTREKVYQCILELHMTGRIPTREAIMRETGLKYSMVDNHFKTLREDGRIEKVVNGVYEPVQTWEDKVVSSTMLDDGRAALEIGEIKIIITPRDARNILKVLGGFALSFGR